MLIGNPSNFAIESCISIAYEELGARALGFFVIHIGGRCYGVREPDATWMANSFDEVERRIARRGKHTAPFATELNAGKIIDAARDADYAPDQESKLFLGIPRQEFSNYFSSDRLTWAPDGDEAFDDGSNVLHFDVDNRVRLIGFRLKRCANDYPHDPAIPSVHECVHEWEFHRYQHAPNSLSDIWLQADEFYHILQTWRDAFEAEWRSAPKLFKAHEPDEYHEQHLAEIIRLAELSESLRQSRGGARN
ncbi:MAG: Imm42 family immunity protein [Verrucomicrobiota bacterium]